MAPENQAKLDRAMKAITAFLVWHPTIRGVLIGWASAAAFALVIWIV